MERKQKKGEKAKLEKKVSKDEVMPFT